MKTPFPIWRIAERQSQLFCHDRPIIFIIALCDPAVTLSVAYRQYIQRRNCQRRPAVRTLFATSLQKQRQSQLFAMTALSFSLSLCATPPLRYLLPIGNISKGGIVSGDPPSGLCLSRYCKSKGSHSFCHDCPIIVFITLCDPAVALSIAYRQHIQRRNCQRRPAVRTLFVTLLQKQGQSQLFCHDRPIIFFIALCDPAATLSVAYRQYIQRRNCQRRPAIRTLLVTLLQKQRQSQLFAMTALSFSLLLCVTPPLRYLLPIDNISKGGIVSGDPPH